MKDIPQESFRWSAHTSGAAIVKPKDYEVSDEIEALSPYAVWKLRADSGVPLRPGDLLEAMHEENPTDLLIAKYIGFEPAQWFQTVAKSDIKFESGQPEAANPELVL